MFKSELKRLWRNRIVWYFAAIPAFSSFITIYGNVSSAAKGDKSVESQLKLSDALSAVPYMGSLFIAIIAAYVVTADMENGYYRYIKLKNQNFWNIFLVRSCVSASVVLILAPFTFAAVYLSSKYLMQSEGMTYTLPDSKVKWIAGYIFIYVLSTFWGTSAGFLIRKMIYSAGAISIYSGFFEIVFTSNLPKIGRFLFGGAQQSIVDSSSMEEKLTAVQGIAVAVAWIVLLTFAAYAAEKRRKKSAISLGSSSGQDRLVSKTGKSDKFKKLGL